jgi:hypothetical protein
MYEHLHNSQNPDFSYEDTILSRITELKRNRDETIPAIIYAIREGNGVLLQKDIYPMIPNSTKNEIQRLLKDLEIAGEITRVKKNSSYQLELA